MLQKKLLNADNASSSREVAADKKNNCDTVYFYTQNTTGEDQPDRLSFDAYFACSPLAGLSGSAPGFVEFD